MTGSTIDDPASGNSNGAGVDLVAATNATVTDNTLRNLYFGIEASNPVTLSVSKNTVYKDATGVDVNANYPYGELASVNINNNKIVSSTDNGIYVYNISSYEVDVTMIVDNNIVTGSAGVGINVDSNSLAIVEGNEIKNNEIGIQALDEFIVKYNTIENNSEYGLDEEMNSINTDVSVAENRIEQNGIGIYNKEGGTGGVINNNLLFNNVNIGIDDSGQNGYSATPNIFSNTIVQSGGVGLAQLTTSHADIENNIFQMTGGTVFDVPAMDQAESASNQETRFICSPARRRRIGAARTTRCRGS